MVGSETDDGFTVSWNRVPTAERYSVTALGGSTTPTIETFGTYATFTGLDPSTEYTWEVYAYRGFLRSESCSGTATTTLGTLLPVLNLTLTEPANPGKVSLAWDGPSGIYDGYRVYRTLVPGGTKTLIATLPKLTPEFVDADVACSQNWNYQVVTYRASPEQESIGSSIAVSLPAGPSVSNLRVDHSAAPVDGAIRLIWDCPDPDEVDGYLVQRSPQDSEGEGSWVTLTDILSAGSCSLDDNQSSPWDPKVEAGGFYQWRVTAYKLEGTVKCFGETATVGGQVPPYPAPELSILSWAWSGPTETNEYIVSIQAQLTPPQLRPDVDWTMKSGDTLMYSATITTDDGGYPSWVATVEAVWGEGPFTVTASANVDGTTISATAQITRGVNNP